MQFRLPQALKNQMIKHALATPDVEVCGLLAANSTGPVSVYSVMNSADDPVRSFFMEPHSQIAALKTMRQHGESLCGIYHSHPNSAALPSDKDLLEAAYPGTAYLIISLMNPEPVIGVFMFDGQSFQEMELVIIN